VNRLMIKSWYKKKPKLFKLAFFYVSIKLLLLLLGWVVSLDFMHLNSLEEMASSDLCLNDLYYSVRNKTEVKNNDTLSGKVILLNTGSLDADSFRADLAKVLAKVNKFQPACIGIDIFFNPDSGIAGTRELRNILDKIPNLVMGKRGENTSGDSDRQVSQKAVFGNISFPENQVSIRRYSADTQTFAFKLAQKLQVMKPLVPFPNEQFVIHYLCDKVVTTEELWDNQSDQLAYSGFYKMEAQELLLADSNTLVSFAEMAKDKIIIVGHLGLMGNSNFDIEDKLRVPTDSNLVNRDRTMHGALIHANAIENWLNPSIRFSVWSDTNLFYWVVEILLILFLSWILFAQFGKFINITTLTLVSIPVAFLIMALMKFHIYLEMGLTMIHILLFEELVKAITPLYRKIEVWLEK
jgi:hypothetical protein